MKSITKRIISTLAICGALVLEAGATAIGSLGKALNNIAKVNAADSVASKSFDLTSSNSDFTATNNVTYFSQPYGFKKAGTLTLNNYPDFKTITTSSSYEVSKIKVTFKCLQNGGTTTKVQYNLLNSSGSVISTSSELTPTNANAASKTADLSAEFTTVNTGYSFSDVTGFQFNITTFGKNVLVNGASYEITYSEASANKLATPSNIAYSNGTLTWDAVEHATGYKVSVNSGTASTVTTNSKTMTLSSFDEVSIVATDSTAAYTDSSAGTYSYINYGTVDNPLTVSEAVTLIETVTGKVNSKYTDEKMYVEGIVTADSEYDSGFSNYNKVIITDSSKTLNIQRCVQDNGSTDTITKDSKVIAYGYGEYYNGATLYPLSDKSNPPVVTVKPSKTLTSISLSGQITEFYVGDTFSFGGTVTAHYSDESSDVVTSSATFSGYDMSTSGTQTVTVSYSDKYGTATSDYNITIKVPTTPYINPDLDSVSGYTGTSEDVGVSYGNLLGTFSATSGNESVASVAIKSNSSGSAVLTISYVTAGNATISLKDGANELATIAVSVSLSTVTISGMPATNSVYIDKTLDLGSLITVTPTGSCGSGVTWSTTDGGKATVDSNGVVTGVAAGTTTIIATPNDYSAGAVSCTVTVSEAPLEFVALFGTEDNTGSEVTFDDIKDLKYGFDINSNLTMELSKAYTKIKDDKTYSLKFGGGSSAGSFTVSIPDKINNKTIYMSALIITAKAYGSDSTTLTIGTESKTLTDSFADYKVEISDTDTSSISVAGGNKNNRYYVSKIVVQYKFAKTLTSITISENYRSFDLGADFVEETVTAHYSDGTSGTVTGATFDGYDMDSVGDQEVSVSYSDSYGSASTSYTINVHYAAATGVELNPTSTDVEKGKTFDLSDVVVTISPSTADQDDYEWSIKNKTEVSDSTLVGNTFTAGNSTGTVTLTCTAGSASADFVINVVDEPVPQLTGFTAEGTPSKATQYRNASFVLDLTGITLKAVYDIKDPETIGSDQFDWDTTGTNPVGTYKLDEDLTVTVDSITLADDFINSISFVTGSDMSKKEYWVGEEWDFSGLTIEGKWASEEELDVDADKVSFSTTSTTEAAGEDISIEVTAHYEGFSGTEPKLTVGGITIKEVEMDSLSIDYTGGQPTLGEEFTFAGSITANMSDGSTQPVDTADVTFSEVDRFITTEQTITVSHVSTGAIGTFKVTYGVVTPQEAKDYWELVTDASTLEAGDEIIIGVSSKNVVSNVFNSKYFESVSGTFDSGKVTFESGQSFILGGDSSGWSLKVGDKYAKPNGSDIGLNDTEVCNWLISISNDGAVISEKGKETNRILYNANSPRFKTYTSNLTISMLLPEIYKHIEEPAVEAELIKLNVSCAKSFKEGDTLNVSDLTISGLYNSGEEKAITSGVTFSDGTTSKVLEAGENTLTLKYGEFTDTFKISATALVKYNLTVDINAEQAEYSISPVLTDGKLIGGKDYTITVTPKEGYKVKEITSSCGGVSGNTVTLSGFTSDVSVVVTTEKIKLAVDSSNLVNCSITDISSLDISYGDEVTMKITPSGAYLAPTSVTIKDEVGNVINPTSAYDPATGLVTFVAKGQEKIVVYASTTSLPVTVNNENVSASVDKATYGESVDIVLSATDPTLYDVSSIELTGFKMAGVLIPASEFGDKASYNDTTHTLTINEVTGEIEVLVAISKLPVELDMTGVDASVNVTSSPEDTVRLGDDITITLEVANDNYQGLVISVLMNGEDVTDSVYLGEGVIYISEVTGDIAVTAQAEKVKYTITSLEHVSLVGGATQEGWANYKNGEFKLYFDADDGYEIKGIKYKVNDGTETTVEGFAPFKLDSVDGVLTITPVVEAIEYKIEGSEDSLDKVTYEFSSDTVHYGDSVTIKFTVKEGYELDSTKNSFYQVAGGQRIDFTGNQVTIENVTSDIVVYPAVNLISCDVSITGEHHELATFDNLTSANYWDELVITFTPNANKQIVDGAATITMGGDDVTDAAWSYNEATGIGTVTLTVKGNVVIDIDFDAIKASLEITDKIDDALITYPSETDVNTGEEYNTIIIIPTDKYEFVEESVLVTMVINGVETDITEHVVDFVIDSGMKLAFTGDYVPVGAIKITTGIKLLDFTITVNGDTEITVTGDEDVTYGEMPTIVITPNEHYHFVEGGVQVINSGLATYTADLIGGSYVIEFTSGVKGNIIISVDVDHDNVFVSTGELNHISFNFLTIPYENLPYEVPYETDVQGYFVAALGYNLPTTITVTCYGETLDSSAYTYDPSNGSFEITAKGDIVISAAGTQGKVGFSLVNTTEEGKATLETSLPAELDSGYTIDNMLVAPEGYAIKTVVVTMGGNVIKNAYNALTGGVYVYSISDDIVITVTTEQIYFDVSIVSNNGSSNGDAISTIKYGESLVVTFTPDSGYHLDEYDTFYGTMGGEDISDCYSNGVLTISKVTGAIEVSFEGWADTYTVTTNLGESTLDTEVLVLEHGDEFFGQVTPNEGYRIKSMVVTMGGNPVTVTDYSFDILSVTGNVVITVETEQITHTVTNNLTHATSSNTTSPVNYGSQYVATITADEGYENLTVKVEMGGIDVTSQYCTNGVIIISKVTGDIEITASATAGNVDVTVNKDAGITSSIVSGTVEFDSKLEGTVLVDNFHDNLVVKVTMGGKDVTGDVYSNGFIVIEKVTGDVVITLTADPMVYLVDNVLDNQVHTNNDATEAAYGSNYVATLIVDNGYAITNVKVTMGNDILTDAYADGTITINGVNGNIVIVAEVAPIAQKISNSLVNASIDNDALTINYNAPYSAVVSIDETKYENVVIKVYMDGVDVSASAVDGMNISIEHVTGPVQIVVSADPIKAESVIEEVNTVAISEGEGYHEVVEAKVGYEITNVQVLVDGEDKTELYYDEATGEINIPEEVSGKVRVIKKSAPITYEISSSLTHATLSNDAQSANYGDRYVATVTAEAGYHIVSVVVKVDGVQVDSAYINGAIVLDIEGNVEITVIAEADEFTVYADCTHVLYDSEQTVVYYNGSFYADLTAEEGYENIVVTVMMNGVDVTKSVYADGVINIVDGVKGNIVITASASLKHYSVTNTLTGVTTDSEVTSVDHNESYSATLALSEGYFNLTYTVTMGGNPVEVSGNTISIEHVTDDIVIVASATKIELQSISASTEKTEIEYDGSLAVGDIVVVGHYNDGIDRNLECSEIANFDAKVVGEQDVTVKAGGLETTIKVTVKASEVISGIRAETEKVDVHYGTSFTKDDVKAFYVYTDGHEAAAVVDSISGFNSLALGAQTITVKVGEYSATLEITVSGRVALSIEVIGYTDTIDQGKDYVFDGKVIAHYNDNTSEEVTGYTVEAVDTSTAGKKTVKVNYEDVSTTFEITVVQTKTDIEPTYMTAIIGGSVVGVAVLAVGIFFFLKMFKL